VAELLARWPMRRVAGRWLAGIDSSRLLIDSRWWLDLLETSPCGRLDLLWWWRDPAWLSSSRWSSSVEVAGMVQVADSGFNQVVVEAS
jgi:hypothetical protein